MKNKPTYEELTRRVLELEQARSDFSTQWERESHLKNVLLGIRDTSRLIAKETDPEQLIREICASLVHTRGYFNAWIALMDEANEFVKTAAASGFNGGFDIMEPALHKGDFPLCMRRSLDKDALSVTRNPSLDCPDCPLSSEYESRSGLSRRLSYGNKVFGIISVSVPKKFAYDREEQDLFSELAADLSYALSKLKTDTKVHHLNQMVRSIPQPISLVSQDYRYLAVNDVYAELFGTTTRKIIGKTPAEFFGKQVFETEIRPRLEHVLKGNAVQYEIRVDFPGLGKRWMSMSYYPYRNEKEEVTGVISHGHDITARKQAEEALDKSEERFSLAMEASRDGIWDWDVTTGAIYCSPGLTSMLGYDSTDVIENIDHWQNLIHPEDRQKAYQANLDCVNSLTDSFEVEYRMMTRNGGWKWILGRGQAVNRSLSGKALRIIGTHKDITEHKQTEEVLRQSKQRFERMLGVVPDMISIHDPEMNILYSNWRGYGAVPEEKRLLGTKCYHTYRGFEDPCPDCRAKEVLITGLPVQSEVQLPDGKWVDLRVIPLKDGQGRVEMFMEWVRDITDTKNIEMELQSQKDLLEGVFDAIKDVIGIQLPDHTVVRYNRAGYDLLGLTEAEVQGKKCYELIGRSTHCEICPTSQAVADKNMRTLEKYVPELKKHFICTSNPVIDENGEINLIIEQLTDITEKKKTDEKLRQAQKMESIGSLAGGIAHDFNNILFPVLGISEMMIDDFDPGSPEYESLKEIMNAGKRGRDLVQQILAVGRQSEKGPIPVQIQMVLKEVLKLLRSTIPANVTITRDIQKDCGAVKADPTQLHQIAMNLITNASHALEDDVGEIAVELKEVFPGTEDVISKNLKSGRYAMLRVSDTGSGISPDIMDRLFDPYFTTKEQGKGTGLGLSVVHGIVKSYGGDITVYSELGKGTSFHVYLPVMAKGGKVEVTEENRSLPTGNERVLVVDDEAPIIKLEEALLKKLGYEVTSRTSSLDALEKFRMDPYAFDLVLTDMSMPNMTGEKLAQEMISIRPDIPVILASGFSERVDKNKAGSMGIKAILMKPVLNSDIAQTVRKVLDEAET